MKKLLFALFIFSFSLCEGQSWVWGSEAVPQNTNTQGEMVFHHSVAVDGQGNAYMTGYYWGGAVTFGTVTLNNPGSGQNMFLVKHNPLGTVLWAVDANLLGNRTSCEGNNVAIDKNGNSYVTGTFTDSVAFGPFKLKAYSTSVFTVNYDMHGNIVWAKQQNYSSPNGASDGGSIGVDDNNNIYITGTFTDSVSFGSYTLWVPLDETGIFVVKYDSSGNVIWAKQGGITTVGLGHILMAVSQDNNVYVAGDYYDTLNFGPNTFINNSRANCFLIKIDSNGNTKWVNQAITPASSSSSRDDDGVFSISADAGGNVYMTGNFTDVLIFASDSLNENTPSGDGYLAKYDSSGNLKWVEKVNIFDNNPYAGYSVNCDTLKRGGGYLVMESNGWNNNNMEFGGETFHLSKNDPYSTATILLQFDSSGKTVCGTIFCEGSEDDGDGVGVDPSGNYIYLGGDLFDTTVFNADTLIYGNDMPFMARWMPCNNVETSVNPILNKPSISIFPNPSTGIFNIQSSVVSPQLSVEVYNVLGEKVYSATPNLLPLFGGSASFSYAINISSQPNGIYLYLVLNADGSLLGEGKMVIQK